MNRFRSMKGKGAPSSRKIKPGTLKRLLSYMADYKIYLVVVVICILISAVAHAGSSFSYKG